MRMKESFVFHAEYIEDLPERYKADFMRYTVDYGLYGEIPPLDENTLEYSLWKKIARRIDAEAEKYKVISERRREAAQRRYSQRTNPQGEAPQQEAKPAPKKPQKEKKAFAKPTVEEIKEYCTERKNTVDAQAFYDFYESKGWKVGAVRMSDWRASVRTWEKREAEEKRTRSKTIWNDNTTDADTSIYENMF